MRVLQSGAGLSGPLALGPRWGSWGLRGLWSVDDADKKKHLQGEGGSAAASHSHQCDKIERKAKTEMRVRSRGGTRARRRWSRPDTPHAPRTRRQNNTTWSKMGGPLTGLKKKPFSGAAANSAQVQIIYLDRCLEEKRTLMSDQVITYRPRSLFIMHAATLFAEAHTKVHGVTFWVSLVRAPDPALSVNLRWLLCVPLWFSCGSVAAPRAVGVFLWVCLVVAAGRPDARPDAGAPL